MKKVLLVVLAVIAAASLWSTRHHADSSVDKSLVTDRLWIDHIPRNERDTTEVFVAVSEHSVGVFQAASQWRGNYEVFKFEASGGELRLVFPQTGNRETVRAKARRCKESQMDFCLDLDGASRGAKRYFSREGWEIDGGTGRDGAARAVDAIERRVDEIRRQLDAAGR
jgi:hypothetical protein